MNIRSTVTGPVVAAALVLSAAAHAATDVYSDFPVTVKGYSGDARNSVSYSGQIARHVLHDSLKTLAGNGNGKSNKQLAARMNAYYSGKKPGRDIIAPVSKGGFIIAQKTVDEISNEPDLASKTFGGAVLGWPGNPTGSELVAFWIDKAADTEKGFDPVSGYNYPQLISKFILGAVFYNQAVDVYLTRNMARATKPNDKPYAEGAPYTGKEHSWDEAFGYFGTPAHTLRLTPKEVYSIAKTDESALKAADFDGDGRVDLMSEMTFGPAYYAADTDKSGKTEYLHTITRAFIDGRTLLAGANGEALSDSEYTRLLGYAETIKSNWRKVLAEAVFKYAGSVYQDLRELQAVVDSNGDPTKVFADYAKHWSELKGFSLALQTSGASLGETAVKLNRLIGYGPVLLGGGQVTGVRADGRYVFGKSPSMGEYMTHMLKIQSVIVEEFGVTARKNDGISNLSDLVEKVGKKKAAETD